MGDTIIVMDTFGVLKGSEDRVNGGTVDFEFMVQYTECAAQVGKNEHVVGWYPSHPGFGCWLSGVDVKTQGNNQKYTDPYIAIVVCILFLRKFIKLGGSKTNPCFWEGRNWCL